MDFSFFSLSGVLSLRPIGDIFMRKLIFLALLIVNAMPTLANADWTCSAKCRFYSREDNCGPDYIHPTQIRKAIFDVTKNNVKTPTSFFECAASVNAVAKSQEGAKDAMSSYCFDYGSELMDLW